jgi:hypothetical protein
MSGQMKTAYLALVRACYSLVVVVAAGFAAFSAPYVFPEFLETPAALAVALLDVALVILAGGALVRRFRGHALVPEPLDHGEWMFAFFMTCLGSFAHFLSYAIGLAIYEYRYVYPDREVEGGPLAFFSAIAAACCLVALLMGEFGIRHDKRSQPRISPSSGRTDALPGNTAESSAADDTPR